MSDDRSDEATYLLDRAERAEWEQRRGLAISRRRLLRLTVGGIGAAALGPVVGRLPVARADHVAVVKPTPSDLFYLHGPNREMRWEAMAGRGYYTPNELFFVRNHSRTPHIDVASWRLVVEGSGVERRIELTYDELLAMPSVTETKFIECAGNGRSQFAAAYGKAASGTPWRLGAVGVAEWTGVPLSLVLERAGLKSTAMDVMPEGLDSLHVRRPMPVAKAVEDDTLVVYAMNGETLPPDHGFPVRLLVPGWIGVANVKWVGRIEVSETPLYSPWNTTTYVLVGDAYPDRPVIYSQQDKSAFELPWDGLLRAGPQVLAGRSWSGEARIERVEVSADGGTSWQTATLGERNIPKAWVQWALPWTPQPGAYQLKARATDARGNTQPDTVPFNDQGYLYWAVVNHPITVT